MSHGYREQSFKAPWETLQIASWNLRLVVAPELEHKITIIYLQAEISGTRFVAFNCFVRPTWYLSAQWLYVSPPLTFLEQTLLNNTKQQCKQYTAKAVRCEGEGSLPLEPEIWGRSGLFTPYCYRKWLMCVPLTADRTICLICLYWGQMQFPSFNWNIRVNWTAVCWQTNKWPQPIRW